VMPMKPKPNKHDRRSYNQSPGGSWRELDRAQEQAKQMPGVPPTQYPNGGCTPYHNETQQDLNSGVRKTAKPKVFTSTDIERSILKALEPVLEARDGTIYSFSDWTLNGEGAVIVLPNGQEFWLTITEAK
jgi:hypothetical protein